MTDDTSKTGRDCDALRPLIPASVRGDLDAAREEALVEHAARLRPGRAGPGYPRRPRGGGRRFVPPR